MFSGGNKNCRCCQHSVQRVGPDVFTQLCWMCRIWLVRHLLFGDSFSLCIKFPCFFLVLQSISVVKCLQQKIRREDSATSVTRLLNVGNTILKIIAFFCTVQNTKPPLGDLHLINSNIVILLAIYGKKAFQVRFKVLSL